MRPCFQAVGRRSYAAASSSRFTIASTAPSTMRPAPPPPSLHISPAHFSPKRVLVLSKITRYEFEKQKHPHLDDTELAALVSWHFFQFACFSHCARFSISSSFLTFCSWLKRDQIWRKWRSSTTSTRIKRWKSCSASRRWIQTPVWRSVRLIDWLIVRLAKIQCPFIG